MAGRITDAQRRRRLVSRHGLVTATRPYDAGTAALDVVSLHATDPASVYLSVWARVDGVTHDDIDRALYDDRSIVKHMAMRRTVWGVPASMLAVVQAAASDDIATRQRRGLAREIVKAGVSDDGEAWVARAEEAALTLLAETGPASGRELSKRLPILQAKVRYGNGRWAQTLGVTTRLTTILSASGRVTRARPGGPWHDRQPRWVLMSHWAPSTAAEQTIPADQARARLADAYLRRFGPATLDDVVWWTGWTLTQTRAALLDCAAVEVRLDHDPPGFVAADDPDVGAADDDAGDASDDERSVVLLPSLDPTTMGWKHRDWYLGAHRVRLFDTYGNAGPTIWHAGRVIGGWAQVPGGEVVVHLLEPVGTDIAEIVDAEAARLTRWLGGTMVRPSFPTPLQRELAGA